MKAPALLGPPLIYSTKSEVTMRRPDKLKVITLGDGPPSEFYYDGKLMMAYAPTENLLAVAEAPPSIDSSAAGGLRHGGDLFPVLGRDRRRSLQGPRGRDDDRFLHRPVGDVGGTTTDMVAFVTDNVFSQVWIGAEDKLPRRLYAVYLNDPARLRHVLELSNWKLDTPLAADAFGSAKTANAKRIAFKRPDADAPGMPPPPKTKATAAQPAATP